MKNPGLIVMLGLLACGAAVAADTEDTTGERRGNFPYKTVTTPEGLTFRVPYDMPIEKRGGIVAPIPFDEYAYGKFGAMEKRLGALEARMSRAEELLKKISQENAPDAAARPAGLALQSRPNEEK